MNEFYAWFNNAAAAFEGLLWHDVVLYVLVITGLLFTIWSRFGQWRALTHGVAVIRGKYDERSDPGAINHFQALSTALSATVGLGNIAGVAVAVALGGPGAVFWMWVIGFLGMALKMTEVTQSMLYRNTSDPANPHGGPMFVSKYGFARWGLGGLGTAIGGLFVVTLLISTATGGNMFQAWNVAATTDSYFGLDGRVTGLILAVIVGAVIIGGIRVIGRVASAIVPFMCVIYLLGALWVLGNNIGDVPAMLVLIVRAGLPEFMGGVTPDPTGAFLGGTFGYAVLWGIKRALFSSEAGQGSAPIAHSAAKTDEPVREGVVAGLEPFIDTLVVCTLTALVILASGAYNRGPEALFSSPEEVRIVQTDIRDGVPHYSIETATIPSKTAEARRIQRLAPEEPDWRPREQVFVRIDGDPDPNTGHEVRRIVGTFRVSPDGERAITWESLPSRQTPTLMTLPDGSPDLGLYGEYPGGTLTAHAFDRVTPGLGRYLVSAAIWLFAISTMIAWSYYGEQGVVYLFGDRRPVLLAYKVLYCGLIFGVCWPGFITTDAELGLWTGIGTGVMLWVNIPLMLIFGPQAMRAFNDYIRRLKSGPMHDEIGREPDSRDPGPPPSGVDRPL